MQDRRIGKTRKAIFTALNELLGEKKFAKITVQDIIDRADIGRATFYAHFPSKDDVLIGYVESFFESFNKQINERINHINCISRLNHDGTNDAGMILPVAALFVHVQDNEKTISAMFKSEGGTALMDKFKKYWIEKCRPIIDAHIPASQKSKIPADILTNHVVNTIIGLITFWLQDGLKHTPEQMEQYFYELISPILSAC